MNEEKENMTARSGFTLVELVVVIAILGILAGIAYPAYTGYIKKANDAKVLNILSSVLTAAESATASCPDILESGEAPELTKIVINVENKNNQLINPTFQSELRKNEPDEDKKYGNHEYAYQEWGKALADFSGGLIIYRSASGGNWPRGYLEGGQAADFYVNGLLQDTSFENAKNIVWQPDTGWKSEPSK